MHRRESPRDGKRILRQSGFLGHADCREIIHGFRAAVLDCDEVLGTACRTELAAWLAAEHLEPALRHRIGDVRARARERVAKFYGAVDELHVEYTLFSEMRVGDAHVLHADAERRDSSGQWQPNHTPWRHSVALLYLNTWGNDFDGGELVFPGLKRIRPCAGELVGFPSTREYCHEVTPITRGSRCVLAMWMTQEMDRCELWTDR